MAKANIEVWPDYDASGRWRLNIRKKRGKLTLDEIKAAAREHEYDFYLLVLDCFHDDEPQFNEGPDPGDIVTLYRTELFYEEGEH